MIALWLRNCPNTHTVPHGGRQKIGWVQVSTNYLRFTQNEAVESVCGRESRSLASKQGVVDLKQSIFSPCPKGQLEKRPT